MRIESSTPQTTFQQRGHPPGLQPPPASRRYRWLQFLLLAGFTLCFFVSILALAALWWLSTDTPLRSTSQALQIDSAQIIPQLALMQLAGDPVDALVKQAYQAGAYETGHALLTFGINTMPGTRIAQILQLAQRLQQENKGELAAQLLRKGRALAILDTQLSPLERADALLQCTTRFLALDLVEEATGTAYQVKRIAEQTPDLLPAERSRLLQDLLPLTTQLDDDTLTQQVQELARSPYLSPNGVVVHRKLHLVDGSIEFDSALAATIQERQLLARQLADALIQTPITNLTPLREALEQALRKEDEQRSLYFTQILASPSLTFSLQFWSLHEQRNWLLLKLAIAHRAFGVSVVPAWEEDRGAISEALMQVTDQVEAALSVLPEPESELFDQLLQRIAALRWLALQTELGFYPERRAAEIGDQLQLAQGELAIHGQTAALPVIYAADAASPGYRIDDSR